MPLVTGSGARRHVREVAKGAEAGVIPISVQKSPAVSIDVIICGDRPPGASLRRLTDNKPTSRHRLELGRHRLIVLRMMMLSRRSIRVADGHGTDCRSGQGIK